MKSKLFNKIEVKKINPEHKQIRTNIRIKKTKVNNTNNILSKSASHNFNLNYPYLKLDQCETKNICKKITRQSSVTYSTNKINNTSHCTRENTNLNKKLKENYLNKVKDNLTITENLIKLKKKINNNSSKTIILKENLNIGKNGLKIINFKEILSKSTDKLMKKVSIYNLVEI